MESKFGNSSRKRKRNGGNDSSGSDSEANSSSSSSDDEDEDDAGELATEALDTEIQAALNAIRTKDPRVYDKSTTFYSKIQDESDGTRQTHKKPPEMYLRDYHRDTLLSKDTAEDEENGAAPLPYTQEQETLRKSIVGEIEAAVAEDRSSEDNASESDHAFLSRKEKPVKAKRKLAAELDVKNADKDPETYLSNFMSSRAWIPNAESRFQPLESDDDEEDRRAEEFEEAYNFRFEDPEKANEKLVSYARDMNQRYTVRRSEDNARKRRRDQEKQQKEIEKQERAEEHARLRKLKVEELAEKMRKIRRAAGLRGISVREDDWSKFLNADWDDQKWEKEMEERFGEEYYAEEDVASEEEAAVEHASQKRRLKKPKWDEDIEIDDLVPDFDAGQGADLTLSESELYNDGEASTKKPVPKKKVKRNNIQREERKQSRKDRQQVEQLADEQLKLEPHLYSGPSKKAQFFRYRETSPTSFGLSAREILMAEDAQLNEYAGLKKLAAFRDPDKKRRDSKRLGKKARLRKWRKDTFGDEEGPQIKEDHHDSIPGALDAQEVGTVDGKKGKRRRRATKKAKVSLGAD